MCVCLFWLSCVFRYEYEGSVDRCNEIWDLNCCSGCCRSGVWLSVCLFVTHSAKQTSRVFFLLLLLPFLPSVLIVERGEKKKNRQEEARVRVCGKVE